MDKIIEAIKAAAIKGTIEAAAKTRAAGRIPATPETIRSKEDK